MSLTLSDSMYTTSSIDFNGSFPNSEHFSNDKIASCFDTQESENYTKLFHNIERKNSLCETVEASSEVAKKQFNISSEQPIKPSNPLLQPHHEPIQLLERQKQQCVTSQDAMKILIQSGKKSSKRPSRIKKATVQSAKSPHAEKSCGNIAKFEKQAIDQPFDITPPNNDLPAIKSVVIKKITEVVEKERDYSFSSTDDNESKPGWTHVILSYKGKNPVLETTVLNKNSLRFVRSLNDYQFVHENGIFASYALEDVRSIATLVFKSDCNHGITYDCFNYETTAEIKKKQKIALIYKNNKYELNQLQVDGKLNYNLHYKDKNNDLMQSNVLDTNDTDWSKFGRRFKKNMIFFNPYFVDNENTSNLIHSFFKYAYTNLDENGVVTLMWNVARQDCLRGIDIYEIAGKNHFKLAQCYSGKKFSMLTNFTHLKNDVSLKGSSKADIKSKDTDTLMLFQKKTWDYSIPKDNEIANSFMQLLG